MDIKDIIEFDYNEHIYKIKLSQYINFDSIALIRDAARMIIIHTVIQFMLFTKNPLENSFFTYEYFEFMLYIILGLALYWLVLKRLFKII